MLLSLLGWFPSAKQLISFACLLQSPVVSALPTRPPVKGVGGKLGRTGHHWKKLLNIELWMAGEGVGGSQATINQDLEDFMLPIVKVTSRKAVPTLAFSPWVGSFPHVGFLGCSSAVPVLAPLHLSGAVASLISGKLLPPSLSPCAGG